MVFVTLPCRGLKAILRMGLNSSGLAPTDLTIGNFHGRATRISPWTSSVHYLHLPDVSSLTQFLPFVDDTNIFFSHRNTDHHLILFPLLTMNLQK